MAVTKCNAGKLLVFVAALGLAGCSKSENAADPGAAVLAKAEEAANRAEAAQKAAEAAAATAREKVNQMAYQSAPAVVQEEPEQDNNGENNEDPDAPRD
jgi:hypothetical protein